MPKRYNLPCKCWLYRCVITEEAIPLSLLHPRWLLKVPEVVVGWEMTFDPSITPADYTSLLDTRDARSHSSNQSDYRDNHVAPLKPIRSRYDRRGLDLMEAGAFDAYELHKKIPESHRAEEYARDITKAIQKVNHAYNNKPEVTLPQSFAVARKDKANLTYKKGGSRRRALTGREAADAEDMATRRGIRAAEIEEERKKRYAEQINIDQEPISEFSQQIWPREHREPSLAIEGVTNLEELIPTGDGDSDIEYLGTQPAQNPGQSGSEDRINTPSPLPTEQPQNEWANIDDFDEFPSLSPASARKHIALMEWPDRRSQQKNLVLPEDPEDPTPSAVTRSRRGVATKSFKQARLESQEHRDAQGKAHRANQRREAAVRKQAKLMKPRKEDVSQLVNRIRSSSL